MTLKLATLAILFSCSALASSSKLSDESDLVSFNDHFFYSDTNHTVEDANSAQWGHLNELQRRLVMELDQNSPRSRARHLDLCDWFFYKHNESEKRFAIHEYAYLALHTKFYASFHSDLFMHRYDSYQELKLSGGPEASQEKCLRQLEQLNDRIVEQNYMRYNSRDLNLYKLLDTYGRVPSGALQGHATWLGQYDECLNVKIDLVEGQADTRYCYASMRQKSWKIANPVDELLVLKAGICLPKSCDSINYKNKYELIEKIVGYHARDVDKNQVKIIDLYCLPDESSVVRSWLYSPRTALTVCALVVWLSSLVYATYKYEKLTREVDGSKQTSEQAFGLTSGFKLDAEGGSSQIQYQSTQVADQREVRDPYFKIYRTLAVTRNIRLLFDTSKASSLMDTGDKLANGKADATPKSSQRQQVVDLRVIEGIKVISMCFVITGHVLMVIICAINNGRDMAASKSLAFLSANLLPAFAVNGFFSITGLLTCYLLFKQNQTHAFITSPFKWIAFIVYRYMRIMPLYVVVVVYTKHLAKFMGSGPLWDYGMTSLGARRNCEQEPWYWTLLFLANFKSPLRHCIPSAWYLGNDFQFFMVTPFFLVIMHNYPKLAKKFLKLCIGCFYLFSFISISNASNHDFRPIATFAPHGFRTYVAQLQFSYTRPQHRIIAYLCGLLVGYILHNFEQDTLKYQEAVANGDKEAKRPEWSPWFRRHGALLCLLFIPLLYATPVVAFRLPFTKTSARLAVAFIMPTYHMLFALAVGGYTLLATTGHGYKLLNDILSASFWKPLARLSLCAVLINIEVITYLVQTRTETFQLNNLALTSWNIVCILGTYLASILVCVLFEAPMRGGLNQLLTISVSKIATKKKRD